MKREIGTETEQKSRAETNLKLQDAYSQANTEISSVWNKKKVTSLLSTEN
jgi:hypothetical protein